MQLVTMKLATISTPEAWPQIAQGEVPVEDGGEPWGRVLPSKRRTPEGCIFRFHLHIMLMLTF